jgi:hypothetical protein
MPMPASAIARTSANMKVVPPRIGESMRYQTSSISRKAKPVMKAAGRAPFTRALVEDRQSCLSGAAPALVLQATIPTARFTAAAAHNVHRLPNLSINTNPAATTPITAPAVFTA